MTHPETEKTRPGAERVKGEGRMEMVPLSPEDPRAVAEMSRMATEIIREHFDPLVGKAQNDYMIGRFQTEEAIREQLRHGYRYFFVKERERNVGFLAYCPRGQVLYLSKFYLYRAERGRGLSRKMLEFLIRRAWEENLTSIELNVNRHNSAVAVYERLGFTRLREEKNDIGSGFFMDDYVYGMKL